MHRHSLLVAKLCQHVYAYAKRNDISITETVGFIFIKHSLLEARWTTSFPGTKIMANLCIFLLKVGL